MGYAELIGLALAAAGTGVSMKASSDARAASNQEIENSLLQQQQFQKQATPLFNQSLQQSTADVAKKSIQQGAGDAQQLYQKVSQVPGVGSTSPLPVDEQRLQGQVLQARDAAAQGQGYSNMSLQEWLKNQAANRQLGTISTLASGAAANTGTLAQLAQQRSAGLAGIGSLMSTAGNLAAVYGGLNSARGSLLPSPTGAGASGPWGKMPVRDISGVA